MWPCVQGTSPPMTSNTTAAQKEILLGYMSKYPSMATNSPAENSGRDNCNKRWEALAEKLNSNGPPIKNVKAWKKTWADYKHRTKRKLATNKNLLTKTGGGPFQKVELSPFEEAVVELAKIKAAFYGICDVKTFSGEVCQPPEKPVARPSSPSSSSSSSPTSESEPEGSVEALIRTLTNDKNFETFEHGTVPELENNNIPTTSHAHVPLSERKKVQHTRIVMDKLQLFKNSASSSEVYHKKVLDILSDIREIKREEVQILKNQAAEKVLYQKRKISISEQQLKVSIRNNELKEIELGLRPKS